MLTIIKFLSQKQVYGTLIIIAVTYILYKLIYSLIDKIVIKGKNELEIKKRKTIVQLFKNISRYILIILMTLILLNLYGVNTTSLIAGLGIAGAVLGLALQDALKDIFNGLSIIFDNYFVVGDLVDYNGFVGTVTDFGLKSTKIQNITGEVYNISNRNIDKIINISQQKATVTLEIPTAYEEKYEKVEKVLINTIEQIKNDNKDVKKVEYLGIEKLDNSSINYAIRFTCTRGTQWDLKRLFLKEIKLAYEKNKIKIPYNQLEVHNGNKI